MNVKLPWWWHRHRPATKGKIRQKRKRGCMITGVQVGGSGVFQVVWNGSPNGGIATGAITSWTSTDPNVTITPVATDPTGQTVTVAVLAADVANSFGLTASVLNAAIPPVTVTATATVPILPATVVPATGGTISQLS